MTVRGTTQVFDLELANQIMAAMWERLEGEERKYTKLSEIIKRVNAERDRPVNLSGVQACLGALHQRGYVSSIFQKWGLSRKVLKDGIRQAGEPICDSYHHCKRYVVPLYVAKNPALAGSSDLEKYAIQDLEVG